MTRRATLRGSERTPLDAHADVLICGASFAGLAVAEPAITAAPASVRSGIRLACAAYSRILDRVEAAGGDVLGRRVGVRARDVPAILVAGRR